MNTQRKIALATSGASIALALLAASPAFADTNVNGAVSAQARVDLGGRPPMRGPGFGMERSGHGVFGSVTVVSGNSITVSQTDPRTKVVTTYTVDATNAKVIKNGAASTISAVAVGDMIMAEGTLSNTTLTATNIHDGMPPQRTGERGDGPRPMPGMGMHGTTTPSGEWHPERGFGGKASTTLNPIVTGNGQPIVAGKITAASGSSITISNASNVTYTIDASTATIAKKNVKVAVTDLAIGDQVIVQGAVNGNAVVAHSIVDEGAPHPAPTTTNTVDNDKQEQTHGGGIFENVRGFFSKLFGF